VKSLPKIEITSITFEDQPDSAARFDRIVQLILGVEEFGESKIWAC
jgi:hypothetical protein